MVNQQALRILFPITRRQLYELLWTTPIRLLAEGLGWPETAVLKLCERCGIPIPTYAYWQSKRAGQRTTRRHLPRQLDPHEVIVTADGNPVPADRTSTATSRPPQFTEEVRTAFDSRAPGQQALRILGPITRRELYELVWTTPIRLLAQRLGRTITAVLELCESFGIPFPTLAYWQSKRAGQRTHRRQLPGLLDPDEVVATLDGDPVPADRTSTATSRPPRLADEVRSALESRAPGQQAIRILFPITRRQLYVLLWTTPIRLLAEGLGRPEAAVLELCESFGIPIPTSAYWQSKRTGQRTTRRHLPRWLDPHEVVITADGGRVPAEPISTATPRPPRFAGKVRTAFESCASDPFTAQAGSADLGHGFIAGMIAAIDALPERERSVLGLRTFGHPPATLQALGDQWHLCRERVRQIEKRALRAFTFVDPAALDATLFRLREQRTTPLHARELATLEPWFAGVEGRPGILGGALHAFGCEHRLGGPEDDPFFTHRSGADPSELVKDCQTLLQQHGQTLEDLEQKERVVAQLLRERGVAELLPMVKEALARLPQGVFSVTPTARLETILRSAGRSMTFAELLREMQPMETRRLSALLGRADIVRDGRGRYASRASLEEWTPTLPEARRDVVALLECEPEQQWRTGALLDAMVEAGAGWAEQMPLMAFEHLLHQIPEVAYLKRSFWGLAEVRTDRLHVRDLAVQLLEDAGRPMHRRDLVEGIRSKRSASNTFQPRHPVVSLGEGMIGLADRDLGLSDAMWQALLAVIDAKLRAGEFVDTAKLSELLVEVGGPRLDNARLRGLLTGQQTLAQRVRSQAAAR